MSLARLLFNTPGQTLYTNHHAITQAMNTPQGSLSLLHPGPLFKIDPSASSQISNDHFVMKHDYLEVTDRGANHLSKAKLVPSLFAAQDGGDAREQAKARLITALDRKQEFVDVPDRLLDRSFGFRLINEAIIAGQHSLLIDTVYNDGSSPRRIDELITLSRFFRNLGAHDEQVECLEKARQSALDHRLMDPKGLGTWVATAPSYGVADAYRDADMPWKALEILEELQASADGNAQILRDIAKSYLRYDDLEKAWQVARTISNTYKNAATRYEMMMLISTVAMEADKLEEAYRAIQQAEESFKEYPRSTPYHQLFEIFSKIEQAYIKINRIREAKALREWVLTEMQPPPTPAS